MRVSLSWIQRLLGQETLGPDAQSLADRVTLRLAEIDEVEDTGPQLDGVVVGKVLTCGQHPNADKLRITTVDVGAASPTGEPLPIVCGAPNVAAGQHVAVATIGTKLSMPGRDGELQTITIKKGKLRGEPSHGMICAEDELGLGDSHDGILVLDGEPAPGTPLDTVVSAGDQVLVVDNHNINHRPDLWGHLGWAREIAAICDLPAPADPDIALPEPFGDWSARIEDDGCRTYLGAVVEGVANTSSPEWMQEALINVGLRPRGFLVDITNYVMLEQGHPMHAFDRRRITGETVAVRSATAGESFRTLDESELSLVENDLVIADGQRALAVAGIMGGQESGVADDTDSVVLEAAVFAPARIRHTRVRTGLASDSSNRFEKGLYPEGAAAAMNRALELIREQFPDAQLTARFQAGETASQRPTLRHDPEAVERFVGIHIDADSQRALLAKLGMPTTDGQVQVPWWRGKDLGEDVDLVEECARLFGYEHVTPAPPRLPAATPTPNPLRRSEHRARRVLSREGWDEVQTYGFSSDQWAEHLQWPAEQLIHLEHPLAADQSVMRWSLLPNLITAAARNLRHQRRVAIYEVGKRYGAGIGREPTVDEIQQIAGVCSADSEDSPFYAARDAAVAVLEGLGYRATLTSDQQPQTGFVAGRSGALAVGPKVVAHIGEIDSGSRDLAGTETALAAFIIDLEALVQDVPLPKPLTFAAPSRYQAVEREFTWVCDEGTTWEDLASATTKAAGRFYRGIELVTVYRGDPIPADHKAVSLKVTLQADDRTLSEKELGKAQKAIIKTVEHQTGASIRA